MNRSLPRYLVLFASTSIFMWGCARVPPDVASQEAAKSSSPTMVQQLPAQNTEQYAVVEEQGFVTAIRQPQSTFAIDVDTASYSNVRRMLREGRLPPRGAVRIEEMVNYFQYKYPKPQGHHPLAIDTELAQCPWEPSHQLLRIGIQGKNIDFSQRVPSNLVFLLDVSGSMLDYNKLPLVKSALLMLTHELSAKDNIAIVVYAGASGVVLEPTPANATATIEAALETLQSGGGTNGGVGIQRAYQLAEESWIPQGNNRVILCTDGDFNLGLTNQSDLVDLIQDKAKSNIFLTVLGFGTGNLNDATMELIADKGNGNYAYIDSILEAKKVLVDEAGGTLVTIAKDVKTQVDFNPTYVGSYRLLGYENRILENSDFRNDAKDAGELGAGHSVTAFYELIPPSVVEEEANDRRSEFVTASITSAGDPETMLTVNVRYKMPQDTKAIELQHRVSAHSIQRKPTTDFSFAASVISYGLLLRQSQFAGQATWNSTLDLATENIAEDPNGLKAEFLQLVRTASQLAARNQ